MGASSHEQGEGSQGLDWLQSLFGQDEISYSQIPTQPKPTQETMQIPQHGLRTNPRPREIFTFPSASHATQKQERKRRLSRYLFILDFM